jgi:hypothetical protein
LDAVILPWVWTYLYKIDPVTLQQEAKARGTCDGGKRLGKIITLAETYAACVEQTAHRLFWGIVAALNLIALGADVGNAFAEAEGPSKMFYMRVDAAFREWWKSIGNGDIPEGYVIPIKKNLQGHPEGPRLWHKHIHGLLTNKMNFQSCTHEPCIYYKHDPEKGLILILRQVDDFIIAANDLSTSKEIREAIQGEMTNPLNDLGIIKRFNGVDIHQTRHYIKLSAKTYIETVMERHGWDKITTPAKPVPMQQDSSYHKELEETEGPDDPREQQLLEETMGFKYRQLIGEMIFAMTTCRLDISPAIIKLSQYSSAPAKCHYQALKKVFEYLYATRDEGIHYWRPVPRADLPEGPTPQTYTEEKRLREFPSFHILRLLKGASDSTWGNDRKHRRSMGGVVFFLAGGAVYYRTNIQAVIALSSTEAEFYTMADAGKAAIYLRSILDEIGLTQNKPTTIYADNKGALCIANAQQPSRRTRHVDLKHFAILEWTDQEYIHFEGVKSEYNISDSLSKQTGRTKFYEHTDILMGRLRPKKDITTHLHTSAHHKAHSINTLYTLPVALSSSSTFRNITYEVLEEWGGVRG